MSTELKSLPKPIKGAGLTNPGVVVLQFLLILLVETIEYSATKVGIITGIAIIAAVAGGFYLGRPGTDFATIVSPPIIFFFTSIVLIATVGGAGLHVTKFGVELVATLGGAAPYLVLATLVGWAWYFYNHTLAKRKTDKNAEELEDATKVDSVKVEKKVHVADVEDIETDPITSEPIED